MNMNLAAVAFALLLTSSAAAWADPNQDLWSAAQSGSVDGVTAALAKGADINGKNLYGRNALFAAVIAGKVEAVTLLINKGSDVNIVDILGQTPVIKAAEHSHTDVAEVLLSNHAWVNLADILGKSALRYATAAGSLPMVKVLVTHGADVNESMPGDTARILAKKMGYEDIATYLGDFGGVGKHIPFVHHIERWFFTAK